jgi:uncharacterized membrane protein (DUF2068 family)
MLRWIAAFKLLKGALLLVAGLAFLRVVQGNAAEVLGRWAERFHLDPDGRIEPGRFHLIGVGMLFYAALLLTEGIGLMYRKRWAEYFTIVATASFIPLELYELARRVSAPRLAVLLVNVAIVIYLFVRVRRERAEERVEPRITQSAA